MYNSRRVSFFSPFFLNIKTLILHSGLFLVYIVSVQKSSVIVILVSLWVSCFSLLASFKICSLSLVFCRLNIIYLRVEFLVFTLACVLWDSLICALLSIFHFEYFLVIITLHFPSISHFLLLECPLCICYIICNFPTVLIYSVSLF